MDACYVTCVDISIGYTDQLLFSMGDDTGLYFDADELPSAVPQYVCWIDIMGIAPRMSRSTKTAANFIFKLHTAVVNGQSEDVSLFPVMDGVYVTSDQKSEILSFVKSVFSDLANEFINEPNPAYQFIPKGTLAYGPTVDGDDVSPKASRELSVAEEYKNAIILGIPVIQAFTSEGKAPPFGVYVHESARTFSPDREDPLPYMWWKWYRGMDLLKAELSCKLKEYYDWYDDHCTEMSYPKEKIEEHRNLAKEYLLD